MLMTSGERDDRPVPGRRMSRVETGIVLALLVLACLQSTRAIFLQNVSWVDLHLYAEGRERMPFQGRVAMMPLLRAAGESRYVGLIAAASTSRTGIRLAAEAWSAPNNSHRSW
jgi:hypothetical protein